jgi:glutaredoxin
VSAIADRIMYVKPGCPYCEGARERLSEQGLGWEERDATTRSDWRDELFAVSPRGVVPAIVEADGAVTVGLDGHG